MARKNKTATSNPLDDMPTLAEVRPVVMPAHDQLAKMIGRYRKIVEMRLTFANLETGVDKLRRVPELADAASAALGEGRYADARQLVGLVQGILYALDIHTWEYIALDDERS